MIHSKFSWGESNGSINLSSLEQDLAFITANSYQLVIIHMWANLWIHSEGQI